MVIDGADDRLPHVGNILKLEIPMANHPAGKINYRCLFDLQIFRSQGGSIQDIQRRIRNWIYHRRIPERDVLNQRWYFIGGSWSSQNTRNLHVDSTALFSTEGPEGAPLHWAVRLTHPDSEIKHRLWRVDIALSTLKEDRVRFALTVSFDTVANYFGDDPEPPDAGTPRIVRDLLEANEYQAFAGDTLVRSDPRVYSNVEEFQEIEYQITSPDRFIPIILCTPHRFSGESLVDPKTLAFKTTGTAFVMHVDDLALNSALRQLPPHLACHNGSVRIYMPSKDFKDPRRSGIHRYFTQDQINENGGDTIERWIINGVSRRTRLPSFVVSNIDDLELVKRQIQFQELRREVEGAKESELAQQYEELFKMQTEEADTIRKDNEVFADLLEEADQDLKTHKDEVKHLKSKIFQLQNFIGESKNSGVDSGGIIEIRSSLKTLPSTVIDILQIWASIYVDKVIFTDEAIIDAKAKTINGLPDLKNYWKCLHAVSSDLYDAFSIDGNTIEKLENFRALSNLDITLTEGKQTKKDIRLTKLRKIQHDGKEYDITPHVKGPDDFRAYFAWDAELKKIIVGRLVHLETYGTRRRKEG